jgi:hypothetical protein
VSGRRDRAATTWQRRATAARDAGFASYAERRRYRSQARELFGDHLVGDLLDEAALLLRDFEPGALTDDQLRVVVDRFFAFETDDCVGVVACAGSHWVVFPR